MGGKSIHAVKGALNRMKYWPSHLSQVIVAGCFISVCILLIAFTPIIFAQHVLSTESCGIRSDKEIKEITNIYFLKHENRTWTKQELCSIETAARKYPDYNIFMINLLRKNAKQHNEKEFSLYFKDSFGTGDHLINFDHALFINDQNSSEFSIRQKLSELSNVQNIDITADNFFTGTSLSRIIENLNSSEIELAAKFQMLWSTPGIALDPSNVHEIEHVRHLFDKERTFDIPDSATVGIEKDLQATAVPCQTFVGLVIKEISKRDKSDRQSVLRRTIRHFCPGISGCDGVQVLNSSGNNFDNSQFCPTVDS